jgi:hypothetical protein
LAFGLWGSAGAAAESPWSAVIAPDNSLSFEFLNGPALQLHLGLAAWGPNWSWIGLVANEKSRDDKLAISVPLVIDKSRGEVIDVKFQAWSPSPRRVNFRYELSAAKDVPLALLCAGLGVEQSAVGGRLVLECRDHKQFTFPLPLGRAAATPPASRGTLSLGGAGNVTFTLDPPCPVDCDGELRVVLAAETFQKGSRSVTLALDFPGNVSLLMRQKDVDRLTKALAGPDWFPLQVSTGTEAPVIGLEEWIERPAGKHGGVRAIADRFQFADGTPVKFWGLNLSYGGGCAPARKVAEMTAARYARYGVNGVRMQQFSAPADRYGIGDASDATRMDPLGLDQLDYFAAQLKHSGVYFGWSHTRGFHVGPGNRQRLAAYDEIARNCAGNTYALINFAEDVQDLLIEMVVNLLKHKNPYTGLTYAQEPALSFLEVQNEDGIFSYTAEMGFNACPTYRRRFVQRFSAWLEAKYQTQAKLEQAWPHALETGESLARASIVPQTNPWYSSAGHLAAQQPGPRQRLLDTAQFLHEVQNRYYGRFARAVRGAGYQGPLLGSPWQAPAMLPHYYNLRSDYLAGYIDRHAYFGGGLLDSMLDQPGRGFLAGGLQQVIDRPFALSVWFHVYPSLYSAEGPPIIAAYGLGLQGWDSSYASYSEPATRTFAELAGAFPWGTGRANVPTQLGQFPTLARMVHRGDVQPADVISIRSVSAEGLLSGKLGFYDEFEQPAAARPRANSVPPEALAAGRVVVRFSDKSQPSSFPAMDKYRRGSLILSATRQLAWDTAGKGRILINTPATKGLVGFAAGKRLTLGDGVSIEQTCPYASIILTAADKTADLATGKRALLSAVARNCNTGFKYFEVGGKVLDNGSAPILLEPVKAVIEFAARSVARVNVLDHEGRRTGRTLSVEKGRFTIDGARDHALYYEVLFK